MEDLYRSPLAAYRRGNLKARNTARALVPQTTGSINELGEQIRVGLKYVKGYISETYGAANAGSYYLELGIQTRGDVYELPRTQKERADALESLETALGTHNLGRAPMAPLTGSPSSTRTPT